jgi:hypothetical protein
MGNIMGTMLTSPASDSRGDYALVSNTPEQENTEQEKTEQDYIDEINQLKHNSRLFWFTFNLEVYCLRHIDNEIWIKSPVLRMLIDKSVPIERRYAHYKAALMEIDAKNRRAVAINKYITDLQSIKTYAELISHLKIEIVQGGRRFDSIFSVLLNLEHLDPTDPDQIEVLKRQLILLQCNLIAGGFANINDWRIKLV